MSPLFLEAGTVIRVCIELALHTLLQNPGMMSVATKVGERTTVFEVDVAREDFGRLLGSKGRNIGSLRSLVAAMAANHGLRVVISIKDQERFF